MSLFDDDKLDSLPAVNNKDKKQSATADDRFELLAKLISTPEQHSSSATIFKKLETLIRKDFLKLAIFLYSVVNVQTNYVLNIVKN